MVGKLILLSFLFSISYAQNDPYAIDISNKPTKSITPKKTKTILLSLETPRFDIFNRRENNETIDFDDDDLIISDKKTKSRGKRAIKDLYKFSLTSHNPSHKVLSLEKNTDKNSFIVYITTYIAFKDSSGYPFAQRKSIDEVFFYPEAFLHLVEFFFSEETILKMNNTETIYQVVKHFENTNLPHVTLSLRYSRMERNQAGEEIEVFKHQFVWLNTNEYQYLLSRCSQILSDMGF